MSDKIETVEGLFGQKVHYKDGKVIGESWPGLFGGSWNHYDADGNRIGSSQPGLFTDLVHYDPAGQEAGTSSRDLLGGMNHYDADGYAGHTRDTLYGQTTELKTEDD